MASDGFREACFQIGRAVRMTQFLEFALTVAHHLYKVQADERTRQESWASEGVIPQKSWTDQSAWKLKEIRKDQAINPEFDARWTAFWEARNLLVHRWETVHGWPMDDAADEAYSPVIEHAKNVCAEALALRNLLIDYVVHHHEVEQEVEDFRRAMLNMFKELK